MKKKPLAVLVSDVHYSLNTLSIADTAVRQAIECANDKYIPLIISGDLHDTKASLRGECVKAILDTLELCKLQPIVLVGNHDRINEKSNEHSLEFLRDIAHVVNKPQSFASVVDDNGENFLAHFIPYMHDTVALKAHLKTLKPGTRIIMHQGLKEAHSGEYIQDKTALTKEDLAGFRVISGHYHRRQTIGLPYKGTFDYIGNPYSLNFGESADPEKGFQILYNDGSLEFVPTNLRRHIKLELGPDSNTVIPDIKPDDLVWVKVTAPSDTLATVTKADIADLIGVTNFRLDLVPVNVSLEIAEAIPPNLTQADLFDSVIEGLTNTDKPRKIRLKELWKNLLTEG